MKIRAVEYLHNLLFKIPFLKRQLQFKLPSLILLSFSSICLPQNNFFDFERITIDRGLSNNSINHILQTSDGFL